MQPENEAGGAAAPGKRAVPDGASGGVAKRRRSGGPEGAYDDLLVQGGCQLSCSRDGSEFEVEDPRKLRRVLDQKLTLNAELRRHFLEGLTAQLGDAGVLHAALKPMTVTGPAPMTGDSFVRVLLNVSCLQADVSSMLLERVAEFCEAEGEEAPLPQLILGQFRWLDHVADPRALTAKLLEVLPVAPDAARRDAITFLPEVATEEDHEEVLRALSGLVGDDASLIPPALEALSNLCLDPALQADAVQLAAERFKTAEPGDLPGVARFLLQHAVGADLKRVVALLREELKFVSAADPRLGVPDRKGKGAALGAGECPEARMLEALRQALQLNPAAADAVLKELKGVAEPGAHAVLDLWLLLVLLTLGAERRKASEALLRRKFAEGHAEPGWLRKGIVGHEGVMLQFFPQLLSLAQQLLRGTAPPVAVAGAELYQLLFRHFSAAYNQQEVLRALHAHLGAQVAAETTAALGVLLALARGHTVALAGYAAFLTNILDYVDGYTDAQVHQVFAIFGELVAGACRQADEGGPGDAGGGRSRMEDELMIFVRKQLSSAQGGHRRVGIIGTVALVQRLGAASSDALESESAIGKRYQEAMGALKDTFDSCQRSPEAFAFLCDELCRSVLRDAIGKRLVDDMHGMLSAHLEDTFCCFLLEGSGSLEAGDAAAQVGAHRLSGQLWWNLDGADSPVALKLLPLLAEELAPASTSAPLLSLFATMRLSAALQRHKAGSLESIMGLLGCPLNLFEMALADPHRFQGLPGEQRRCVLLGLWYALNWCRELANCFAGELSPDGSGDQDMQLKLFARLRCCCQLEALLDALLQHAPPLFVLPPLGNTLDGSPGALAALVAAPKASKPKGGKKGGKAKKEVKFAGGEDDEASPGAGSRGRAATSQHTTSGGAGSALQQTSSGATQAGGIAATQAVTAAASAGLQRLAPERWRQRSLLLPALATLGVGAAAQQEQPCFAMLPSAAYVLSDLHGKLKAALAAPKRASFPGRPSRQPQLPADLSDLTAGQLLEALLPVLPAMRRHLDAACEVIEHERGEAEMQEHDREHFWSALSHADAAKTEALVAASLAPWDNPVASAALSPVGAAARVRTLAFDCVLQLLQWPGLQEPDNRPLLHAVLSAFGTEQAEASEGNNPSDADLMALAKSCFSYFSAAMPELDSDQPTTESPSHQHAALLLMDAVRALVGVLDGAGSAQGHRFAARMSKRISKAADSVLRQVQLDEKGQDAGGGAWRGRGPLLGDVLRLHLSHRSDRVEAVRALAAGELAQVPDCTKGADAAASVDPYPSLCGHTVATWYRACFEQLQAAWDAVVVSAASAVKEGMTKDEEITGPIVQQMQDCAAAFSALLGVVKCQTTRVPVHVQAVKSGGRFLEAFFRALPFWATQWGASRGAFQTMVKDIQRGARVLQTLCSEGKAHKQMPLTAKVPMVKRTVERFIFQIKVFLAQVEAGGAFWMGQLKHKDLSGREVPTQVYDQGDDDDDEGGEEDEYEEDEGEDEEVGESQHQ